MTLAAGRLGSQLLTAPSAGSPEEVVDRLLAVQAQDDRGARLSVRARSTGLVAADVDRALSVTRSLIVTWLNRGTLHMVQASDYWWLHRLTTPQLATQSERRLRQEGITPAQADRGVAIIVEAVTSEGPLTRADLRQRLDDAGVRTVGQALVQLLFAASLREHVVRGPMVGRQHAFVSAPHWLGPAPSPLDHDEALGLLARRYLSGHGPAAAADLARWANVPLGDARVGFDIISSDVVEVNGGAVLADRTQNHLPLPAPRLLGPFDPLLLGWVSRDPFVGTHRNVVTTNGIFRPVALVDGRVVATWRLQRGVIQIELLERISSTARDALIADSDDVLRYLGLANSAAIVRR